MPGSTWDWPALLGQGIALLALVGILVVVLAVAVVSGWLLLGRRWRW